MISRSVDNFYLPSKLIILLGVVYFVSSIVFICVFFFLLSTKFRIFICTFLCSLKTDVNR